MTSIQTSPYLDILRRDYGRTHKISYQQMIGLLLTLHCEAELPLAEYAGWYGCADTASPHTIATAIARAVHEITVVSLGGQVRDIQYDQPGSMHPSQHAQISFVSTSLAAGDWDAREDGGGTLGYIRDHASRVLIVTGQRPQMPPKSDPRLDEYGGHMVWTDRDRATADGTATCPLCKTDVTEFAL